MFPAHPFNYHITHESQWLEMLIFCLPVYVDLWWCVFNTHCSVQLLQKKQLELPPYCPTLTKPAPPPPLPLPACVCVHDCGCVYEEAWQWKELRLSSGSLREWLQSRSRSLQIIIHVSVWASEGEGELRLSSVYSELAGGHGRPWSNTSHTCHSNITKEVL